MFGANPHNVALVNDRALLRARTGVGQYLYELCRNWPKGPDRIRLISALGRLPTGLSAGPGWVEPHHLEPVVLRPLRDALSCTHPKTGSRIGPMRAVLERGYGSMIHAQLVTRRPGVFFEPNNIPGARHHPTVVTVHDLSALELPEMHPPERAAAWERAASSGAIQCCEKVVCVSNATAKAVSSTLGVPAERIEVIPLAARWSPPPKTWDREHARTALGLPQRYALVLGTVEPRKNLRLALDAYGMLPEAVREKLPLIIVGRAGWGGLKFWNELCTHPMAERALYSGYLGEPETMAVAACARMLLFPSLHEGFGLPLLEALALGIPAISSDAAALVEVGAGAARIERCDDPSGWAQAIQELQEDSQTRRDAIAAGRARAKDFSWAKTADRHERVLSAVARG